MKEFTKTVFFFLAIFTAICSNIHALTVEDIPIIPCAINRSDLRQGELAICSLFQNEADFLQEWIEFHRLVGVTHFYLYNNQSQDHYWQVLKPYVDQGIVELFDVPFDTSHINDQAATLNFMQKCCYDHAIRLARGLNTWLAIIDSDEFLTPVQGGDLPSLLSKYLYAGGVAVYWQVYGTSSVWSIEPNELMIEKLVHKYPEGWKGNFWIKSIVQPQYAENLNPHQCSYSEGRFAVNANHEPFTLTPEFSSPPIDVIRINHYSLRTEKFFQTVKKPRRKAWGSDINEESERLEREQSNSVYDPILLRYVGELKKRLYSN